MMTRKMKIAFATVLGAGLLASTAVASVCQVYSTTWNQTLNCGLAARGYAKGYTTSGIKFLEAKKTIDDDLVSVGAVGIASNGAVISACRVIDDNYHDNLPEIVAGGVCGSAVKFAMQVNY